MKEKHYVLHLLKKANPPLEGPQPSVETSTFVSAFISFAGRVIFPNVS